MVKYAILGLLQYRDMHGYRVKEHIERNFGHMWTVNFGQIYPALRHLQEDGLVTMVEVPQENAPPRKLYTITPRGREEFARWLRGHAEKKMVLRDPFLLRFAFFGFGDREQALSEIREQISVYEEQLHRRKKAMAGRRGDIYVRLLSELGISLNEAMLAWLRRAAKEIAAHRDSREQRPVAAAARGRR